MNTTPAPHAEALDLIRFAVAHRTRLIANGHSRLPDTTAQSLIRPIQTWLRHNITPSPATLRQLWQQHGTALRVIMPANCRRKLQRLETIMYAL